MAPPFTKRPEQGAQQLVRCWVELAGSYDGEEHEVGEYVYLDEVHAHVLQRKRKVRVCTFEEAAAVERAEERAGIRSQSWPRLSMDIGL